MIISMGFYRRKPGLSIEEFRHIWTNIYGPLYGVHPEIHRHLRRYVQHQLSPNVDHPESTLPFDGFSEAWFDDIADRARMHAEPIYQATIAPLMATFLDIESCTVAAYDAPVYQIGAPPAPTFRD